VRKLTLLVVALLYGIVAHAYELGTHARLTQQAYSRSVLQTDVTLFRDLGVDKLDADKPFGESYLDVSGGRIEERTGKTFSTNDKRMPGDTMPFSIQGWLMRGAIREDDYLSNFDAKNPQDDPYGMFNRPLRHFYDPINHKGLLAFTPAPDWATGSKDSFANPVLPDTTRRNHFTLLDARESEFRALTGKDLDWNTVAANKAERDKYWATVFRALGDVLHLVQDMGQPQHTRNDRHSGNKYDGFTVFRGHKSVFEAYVDARAKQEKFFVRPSQTGGGTLTNVPVQRLNYSGYPIPVFDDFASYFSTWHIDGPDPLSRRGLADYSNRGFFSAGTNFGNTGNYLYPDPDPESGVYISGLVTTDWKGDLLPNGEAIKVLRGTVNDSLTGSRDQAALSSFGLWDQFLVNKGQTARHTLTKVNYDDMANLLIPRTVAYSAGVINHFFRGRLEIRIDQYTGQSVTLKFVNRSNADTLYSQDGLNELSVVYRYEGANGEVFGTSEADVSLASGDDVPPDAVSAQSYTFTFQPPVPPDAKDLTLQLVYRGKLGKETDAVAVGSIEMTSPGFIFNPGSTPADGIGGSRYIYRENGKWVLSSEQGLVFGNIDWKGWYVNGKPTQVLSWQGPASRYFHDNGGFTPNVYYNGELFSVAPYPVLGAALNKDATGDSWIVVICQNGSNDLVLKRPFTKNTSTASYDPALNPGGWRVLGEFAPQSGYAPPDRPWFFNGSGTEAQTMRVSSAVLADGLERLKITVGGNSAIIEYLGNLAGKSSFGYKGGNGCVTRHEENMQCSGTWDNPTGSGTTDNVWDNRYSRSTGWTGSYVVAVDYIDERETLATLSLDDVFLENIHSTNDQHGTLICYLQNDGGNGIDSASVDRKDDSGKTQTINRMLRLSSEKITDLVINQRDYTNASTWPHGKYKCPLRKINPLDYSGCISEKHGEVTLNNREISRRIDFMDLRNGTVLSSALTKDEVYLSRVDAVNQDISAVAPVLVQSDKTTISSYELWLDGTHRVLYSNSATTPGATAAFSPTNVADWKLSTLCRTQSTVGQGGSFSSMTEKITVPLGVPSGNIVSDLSGNIFASIQYRDVNGDQQGFNFLTNGDPAEITGITNLGAIYSPIGLR